MEIKYSLPELAASSACCPALRKLMETVSGLPNIAATQPFSVLNLKKKADRRKLLRRGKAVVLAPITFPSRRLVLWLLSCRNKKVARTAGRNGRAETAAEYSNLIL